MLPCNMRCPRPDSVRKLLTLGIPLFWGCFPQHPTPLPSCAVAVGMPLSEGTLRILPSKVPTITIDSAHWESVTESPELSTETSVRYWAYLSAKSTIPLASFAVQFRSSQPAEDSILLTEAWQLSKRCREAFDCVQVGGDSIRPGEPRRALAFRFLAGEKPGPWGCPQSAQVIEWRQEWRQRRP